VNKVDFKSVIERHKAFWELNETHRPLIGYSIGGWSQLQQYSRGVATLPQGQITPEMLNPELFLEDYKKILEYNLIIQDDLIRTVEPFPAMPWIEAIIGCPVYNSGKNIWSEPLSLSLKDLEKIQYNHDSTWVKKYKEFLHVLTKRFGNEFPVGQAILRGPADLLSAALGETKFLYALNDNPDQILKVAQRFTEVHNEFLKNQITLFPTFQGGYVIGQYHIWAPGRCSRLQDDAMSLLSPNLYKSFFQNKHREMAMVAEFNLFHFHTSSLFLLNLLLEIEELKVIQVSLDTGGPKLEDIIKILKGIQEAGKCLVIKGVLNEADFISVRKELSMKGLCLQAVVSNVDEARPLQDIVNKDWRKSGNDITRKNIIGIES